MPTLDQTPTTRAAETTARYSAAAEANDIDGVLATMAPDVTLHSPITERVTFNGRDEMRELLAVAFETISDIRYFEDIGDARTRVLFFRGMVGRQPVEEAARLTLNDDGLITELTLFFRPLPGLTALAAKLGPRITARRHGAVRARLGRLLLAPIAALTRIGDRFIRYFA
jgi:SnoaL-like domain